MAEKKSKTTQRRERKAKDQSEMVIGGAGQWEIRDGKFYDPVREKWVILCHVCNRAFYATKRTATACGGACRKARSRSTQKDVAARVDALFA